MGNCQCEWGSDQKEAVQETAVAFSSMSQGGVRVQPWVPREELDALPPGDRCRILLADGTVRLLSTTWLLSLPKSYILQRQQDLPEEAFVPPCEAEELVGQMSGVVALSYTWLSQWHPDPAGFHFKSVTKYMRKHRARFSRFDDVGVFWDFASLPQCGLDGAERTEKQEQQLQRGLRALCWLYGSSSTMVLQLTSLPKEPPQDEDEAFYRTSYSIRGWCFWECTVAAVMKDSDQLVDLGAAKKVLEDATADWDAVLAKGRGSRLPPLTPDDMELALQDRQFTYGDDATFLANTYREFFTEATRSTNWLIFENGRENVHGWTDEELKSFVRALPLFEQCEAIRLYGHRHLTEEGLAELRAQLILQKKLGRLFLPKHLEATREGKAVKSAWAAAGKMPGALVWC